jgi:hypothetical protein
MTQIELLFAALTAHAGIEAIVGERIYPVIMPEESEKPVLLYTVISTGQTITLTDGDGTVNQRVQFSAFATSHKTAHDLLDQVRDCMVTDTTFKAVFLNELDNYDAETRLFYAYGDYSIWY